MRAYVQRESFLVACMAANAAVPSKELKPILKSVRMEAGGGRCTLAATDLEIGLRISAEAVEVHEAGVCLLPAAKTVEILKEARDPQLELLADDSTVTIRGTTTALEFVLPTENADAFPDVPQFPEGGHHAVEAAALATLVRRIVFACADEAQRYSMTGLLVQFTPGGGVRLVGTDGKRLAIADGFAKAVGEPQPNPQPVVPERAVTMLAKMVANLDEADVAMRLDANEAFFSAPGVTLWSRLVEGKYPQYQMILPKGPPKHVITANAGTMMQAVRQAAVACDKELRRVSFAFGDDKLTLEAKGSGGSRSRVEAAVKYGGDGLAAFLNPDYVLDMLRVLPGDAEVTLEAKDAGSPIVFRHGSDFTCLVMGLT